VLDDSSRRQQPHWVGACIGRRQAAAEFSNQEGRGSGAGMGSVGRQSGGSCHRQASKPGIVVIMQLAGVGAETCLSWANHWDAGSAMGAQGRWLGESCCIALSQLTHSCPPASQLCGGGVPTSLPG
jgi:hypothetical protein